MIHRDLDGDGDWRFGQGKTNYLTDDNAIMLNIKTRVNEWYRDCFFAQLNGIDWKNRLDKGQKNHLDLDIRTVITESFGVVELISFSSSVNAQRKYSAQFVVKTIFSESVQGAI